MGVFQTYAARRLADKHPELFREYLADVRAQQMAQATPYVVGTPEQGSKEAYDYPMMEEEEAPISGLWETSPDYQEPTGLFDESKPMTSRVLEMTQRAAMSGVPDYQSMAVDRMKNMTDPTGSGAPMNVKEWQYFSTLSPQDQQRYLDMKRSNYQIVDVNEVPTRVPQTQIAGGGAQMEPLSTFDSVADAAKKLKAAEQEGASSVLSEWKRIDQLKTTIGDRESGRRKAEYFYDKLYSGEMASGGMRWLLSFVPFTFTAQGRLDEEFNAFAETAARAALKAAGEVRPTDADVKGMKQAMFGIGRDEKVNMRLLRSFIDSIERENHEAYQLDVGSAYIEKRLTEVYGISEADIAETIASNPDINSRREVFMALWKRYNEERQDGRP